MTKYSEAANKLQLLKKEISKHIIGQDDFIESLIFAFLAHGHLLVEGAPGLAKSKTVALMARALDLDFGRIQFTSDLVPSDLLGAEIYNPKTSEFQVKKGPIFRNFLLADEINRAPAKLQSALLEAMAEKHITIGNDTFLLEEPFIVVATQNPLESSGVYELPEAELDRFMMKIRLDYPKKSDEVMLYKTVLAETEGVEQILSKIELYELQQLTKNVYISDAIYSFVATIIDATRYEENYDMKKELQFGASPRGGLALLSLAQARAVFLGRDHLVPEDIQALAHGALAHRVTLSYEAELAGVTTASVIDKILATIKPLRETH